MGLDRQPASVSEATVSHMSEDLLGVRGLLTESQRSPERLHVSDVRGAAFHGAHLVIFVIRKTWYVSVVTESNVSRSASRGLSDECNVSVVSVPVLWCALLIK